MSGFTPTPEQETARTSFATGRSLAIEAGAGAEHRGTGFVGYSVTANGEVWSWWLQDGPPGSRWSLAPQPQRRLSPGIAGANGYEQVWLRRDGKRVGRYVHSLVLVAFVGPQPAGMEARHLNGQQRDNRACNLAWGSHAENMLDRDRHGRTPRGAAVGTSRLDREAVSEIRLAHSRGESIRSLARRFPVSRWQIARIVHGESWA